MTKVKFTKFTKPCPGIMTKDVKLVDGQIVKDGSQCWLSTGTAETIEIPFRDLPTQLDLIEGNQAVAWGICKHQKTKIVKQSMEVGTPDAISRTGKHFSFPKGKPGVMMLDNDTGLATADFVAIVEAVMPKLIGVARIERPSCSSDIYAGDQLLTSEGTGRIYYLVGDGSQIPRIGKALHRRLILAGHGSIQVTKSGSMLARSPADDSVWQAERLDFVAAPVLEDGLDRRAPQAKHVDGSALVAANVPDFTNEEEVRLDAIVNGLKAVIRPEADKAKALYIGDEAEKLVKSRKIPKADATTIVKQRAVGNLIDGDVLHFDELETVSVADVLADPARFDKQTLADPLEPDYGGGRCKAMLFVNDDDRVIINSMAHGGRAYTVGAHKTVTSEFPIPEWPTLDAKAFNGFVGDFVRLATINSEADPAAVLITFLTRFGVEVGCGKTMAVGDTKHKSILASVIVGSSSKARKGTSAKPVERLFSFPETLFDAFSWPVARSSKGPFSSGEGIIFAIRDKVLKWDVKDQKNVVVDPGVDDKRLFVLDEEFGGVLANTKREGNTLSMIIRQCWDGGTLDPLTKNNKIRATNGVVGWVSHITLTELNAKLAESESFNGFANRILWCLARRQKLVPIPQPMPRQELEGLQTRLLDILKDAGGEDLIKLSPEAADAWCNRYYADLTKDRPGLAGCTTNRGEAQVLRLAMVYCFLDGERVISIDHLESGLAVWEYCRQSANYIFAGRQEDATSQKILESLEQAPMTRTKLYKLFQNNVSKDKIQASLKELIAAKRIEECKNTGTGGAPSLTYRIIKNHDEFNESNEITPINEIRQGSKFVNSLISLESNKKIVDVEGQPVANGEIWEVNGCDC